MAIPRGKQYYVDFIVYDKSSPPDGRISGISGSQFTILWARDNDTTMTDISSIVQPTISEIGTEGRYRFLLGPSYMDGDRISLEIRVPGNTNAYIIPISIYTTSLGTLANEIWGHIIEAGKSAAWMMRIMAASLVGKVSGAESNTPRFRDVLDTKNRITMVVDDSGNRTEVTLNGD